MGKWQTIGNEMHEVIECAMKLAEDNMNMKQIDHLCHMMNTFGEENGLNDILEELYEKIFDPSVQLQEWFEEILMNNKYGSFLPIKEKIKRFEDYQPMVFGEEEE